MKKYDLYGFMEDDLGVITRNSGVRDISVWGAFLFAEDGEVPERGQYCATAF